MSWITLCGTRELVSREIEATEENFASMVFMLEVIRPLLTI